MEILRNMWRRKFRTFLTVFGIIIGIFAFTVMGSMALKLNKMIDGGKRYITGQITVSPKGSGAEALSGMTSGTLPVDILNKIAKVDGVKAVAAGISLMIEEPDPENGGASFSMGPLPSIMGVDSKSDFQNVNWTTMDMKEGAMIDRNTKDDEITIGYNIALDKKLKSGDAMKIRGRDFKVIGVIDKTMTGPDSYVMMQMGPARQLFVESNPFLKSLKEKSDQAATISASEMAKLSAETQGQLVQAKSFKMEDVSTSASVSWKDDYDSEVVAKNIKDELNKEVSVLSPVKMGEEIDKASAMINSIILGSAMLALIVGLFSIVNTMVMSISERTKEIGIKKAIGASNKSIALEYTLEAGVIGLVGGIIGGGLGLLVAAGLNSKMAEKGGEIFLISPSFLVGVLVFSFCIGIVAGFIPAMRAAKLKVVDAIREL
ncbi:MAG: FtsX-like permease family protein [Patescibacteria group bacterium]